MKRSCKETYVKRIRDSDHSASETLSGYVSIDKVGKTKHNKILLRYRSQKIDNMFRPFFLRQSSGLTSITREESQCYMVRRPYIKNRNMLSIF
jgi:hypothetical protein